MKMATVNILITAVKVTYLADIIWFNSIEEAAKYYEHPEVQTVEELNEVLEAEYGGMCHPFAELKEF